MRVTEPVDAEQPAAEVPPYRGLLAVDAEAFSERPSVQQSEVNAEIEQTLAAAFGRAGLTDAWNDRRFPAHTGDGYVLGLPHGWLPRLLHPLLSELQTELRHRNGMRPASEAPLRLRVSLHIGAVPDGGLPNDGVGRPMTETHRLLDCEELRRALRESHPDVTFVAAIVSRRVYEDVVQAGYTALHPAQFRPVDVTVKGFTERAYLHVPEPSSAGLPATAAPHREPPPLASGNSIRGDRIIIHGDVVGRDKHVHGG
jgi:hypothetical protein